MIRLIECHGKIFPQSSKWPSRDLSCFSVDYSDLLQVRDVHIDIRPGTFELEGLRFAPKLIFLIKTLIAHRIDSNNGRVLLVVAASYVHALGCCVVAQV